MAEEFLDMECISLYGCIRNTFTDAAFSTKYQLDDSKSPWPPEKILWICAWLGRMKERKGKEKSTQDWICSWEWGNWGKGETPTSREIYWDRNRAFEAVREGVRQLIHDSLNRVRTTKTIPDAALHTWDWGVDPLVHMGAGSESVGIGEQSWDEDCCWMQGDGLMEQEGRSPQWGMPLVGSQVDTESHSGGLATTLASLSPHPGTGSWIEKNPSQGFPLRSSFQS